MRSLAKALVVFLVGALAPWPALADDTLAGTAARATIIGATTTLFVVVGTGAGLGLAYGVCPMVDCPRFHPGQPPGAADPIDPVVLGAGAVVGAAMGGGLGAFLSGAVVVIAME